MKDSVTSLAGKTCLVTGATAGIGRVTARELARAGATVVLVGRNAQRGKEVVEALSRETGNTSISFLRADMSSQASVRQLAAEFTAAHQQLHVLVNNVGGLFAIRQESVDGIEMTLALNHLAPFLLTQLLLDTLKASAPARVVNVASEAHTDVVGFDFDDPQAARTTGRGTYPRSEAASTFYTLALPWAHPAFLQYARCKLANVLFTTELARRLAGTGVTANALHPGLVASDFGEGNGVYGWFMRRFLSLRGISVEAGAATGLYLAMSPAVGGVTGGYFEKQQRVEVSDAAADAKAAAKLWLLSEEMTARKA